MRLGAQFLVEDFEEYLTSVRCAEEAGYEFAWLIDSQLLWQDVYVYLARGLAASRPERPRGQVRHAPPAHHRSAAAFALTAPTPRGDGVGS